MQGYNRSLRRTTEPAPAEKISTITTFLLRADVLLE